MLKKATLVAGFVIVISALATPLPADFQCTRYSNSAASYFGDYYGWACAETGPGCTECINFHPGGVQWCHWGTPTDIYCIDQAY